MKKHRSLPILLSILCILFLERDAPAGSNLPQARVRVAITGKNHQQLKQYFRTLGTEPTELDRTIEEMLISVLPREYKAGCQQMISSWGRTAKGTASKALRLIYLRNPGDDVQQAILAYTCYSIAKEYGEKFYDERLAFLTIDSASSSLLTIPLGQPCATCSGLSHIGIDEDTLRIDNRPAICVNVEVANNNPCCPTPLATRSVTIHYFTFERDEMTKIISIAKNSSEITHDAAKGDSTTARDATITYEKDAAGNIIKITSLSELTSNGRSLHKRLTSYLWNRKSRSFQGWGP